MYDRYIPIQTLTFMLLHNVIFMLREGRTIRKVMGGGGGGGGGEFRAAGIFLRYQIPCMNFFLGRSMNIF